ncbi:hypothetical protein [Micromonospora sp. NPDC049171]|uniref:hypothetical protein n=1 Tax=Micromonospora sp. NPDC049171 TaxID=3155770 RepID=UPI0033C4CA87
MESFIENAAAWGDVQGWRYVAVGDLPLDLVLDTFDELTPDVRASGQFSGWWTAQDLTVIAQRYLNPARSRHPQVSVAARTPGGQEQARHRLAVAGAEEIAFKAAELSGTVSTLRLD